MKKADKNIKCRPVVKWCGGKQQLMNEIKRRLPDSFDWYYEPFFGGGALFFELQPEKSVINDINRPLMDLYNAIKYNPALVIQIVNEYQSRYNSLENDKEKCDYYYRLRDAFNESQSQFLLFYTSALFLFLNKSCFNGLYRVNKKGLYNVPPAHRKEIHCFDEKNIHKVSALLKNAKLMCGDFEESCKGITKDDFVFFDTPYYGTFDKYSSNGFSNDAHKRLFELFVRLSDKGVKCMLTNNDHEAVWEMYKDYNIESVDAKRQINSDSSKRTGKDLIITNY